MQSLTAYTNSLMFHGQAKSTRKTYGIPDHLIKTLGRWIGDAYQLYIKTPTSVLEGFAARMVS